MKRSVVFLALALCLLVTAAVQPALGKDNWISVRSKNFFLIGNGSEKEIRQVATRLEQFREVFSRLFPRANFASPVPTTVVVFKNAKSYAPFQPGPNTAGYFQAGPDVNYIALTTEMRGQQDPFTVIFHEYTHLLVNSTSGNVPTWFNEGLAEYYSTVSITDDQKFVLGKPIGSHVYLLREKKMLPLRTLFQVDQKSPYYNERDKQSVFYAQSWAILHYLILGKGAQRADQVGKFVEELTAGVAVEQAFQQVFKISFEEMEKELREYIRNDRYPIVSGHFTAKIEIDKDIVAAPITEAEAQAYLGDLLLHSDRAEAETYLKKALELNPQLAMAHASLGMFRMREGKHAEARQSLERAVASNTRNYLIHYYYAFALSRERSQDTSVIMGLTPEDAEKIRVHLNKAIELRPDFLESYSLMAYVNVVTGKHLDESLQSLKRALKQAPGRNDLSFMLAQVYARKDDYKSAREILQKLSENNGDADLRQRAQELLRQLSTIEDQQTRHAESVRNQPVLRDSSDATNAGIKVETDPLSYLREALRQPLEGETQAQGTLTRIDCDAKGITFVVSIGPQVLRLTTTSFEKINLTSFSSDAGHEIRCGPRKPENNVVVSYIPSSESRSRTNGVLKSVEFVPKEFKL